MPNAHEKYKRCRYNSSTFDCKCKFANEYTQISYNTNSLCHHQSAQKQAIHVACLFCTLGSSVNIFTNAYFPRYWREKKFLAIILLIFFVKFILCAPRNVSFYWHFFWNTRSSLCFKLPNSCLSSWGIYQSVTSNTKVCLFVSVFLRWRNPTWPKKHGDAPKQLTTAPNSEKKTTWPRTSVNICLMQTVESMLIDRPVCIRAHPQTWRSHLKNVVEIWDPVDGFTTIRNETYASHDNKVLILRIAYAVVVGIKRLACVTDWGYAVHVNTMMYAVVKLWAFFYGLLLYYKVVNSMRWVLFWFA